MKIVDLSYELTPFSRITSQSCPQRNVEIDGLGPKCYGARSRERRIVHEVLRGNNVPVIESMTNLHEFRGRGTPFIPPVKVLGLDALSLGAIDVQEDR